MFRKATSCAPIVALTLTGVSPHESRSSFIPSHRVGPLARGSRVIPSIWGILSLGLILLVSVTWARGQNFDPRCGDRTATGKFDCAISRPIVNRPEWIYQNVEFAPDDTVYVKADGCVQTGGSGDTWKRYVNPSGDGSDHLYHGLIRIPTAKLAGTDVGNSLTRIKNVVGRPLKVTGQGAPASQLVLHLGYEDDDLSDNSYNDHDDGTEDQCKGGNGNDGGPAHITITICRGVPCGPASSRFPFDVLSSGVDPNGFLLNPHWSWHDWPGNHGKPLYTSLCHEFSKHDFGRPYLSPNFPDCTDQAGLDSVDARDTDLFAFLGGVGAGGLAGSILGGAAGGIAGSLYSGVATSNVCKAGKVLEIAPNNTFAGHVNWFPITVEGRAGPISHESGLTGDDDYDFSLSCDDRVLVGNAFVVDDALRKSCQQQDLLYTNDRRFLHVEFDSDETIDHFTTDPWVDLRANVNSGTPDSAAKRFSGHTIMTGLFGLDGEHGFKSELHPLYAMATRRDMESASSDEVWLIFVRNRGDEGYCSSQIWDGGFEDYTFRLPWRDGMTSVEVNWDKTIFEGTPGTSTVPMVGVVPPAPTATTSAARRGRSTPARPAVGTLDRTSLGGAYSALTGDDAGVYVTFHLGSPTTIPPGGITWGPPASIPYIDGALHLKWTGPMSGAGLTAAGGLLLPSEATTAVATEGRIGAAGETDEAEHKLETAIVHLSPPQRKAVLRSRAIASPPMPAVHRMSRGGPVEVLTAPPATGVMARSTRLHDPIAGPAGRANRKLARDEAQMRALCSAANNAPYGLPPEVCKANVRDHRNPSIRDHR